MKRFFAFALAAVLAVSALPLFAAAFGTADKTMAITHINERNIYEGAGIIIDGGKYEKIGDLGGYNWWNVLIFDWDADEKCYKLVEKNINSNNVDKSSMEIPRTGFAYGACVGNNYSSSGGINYTQTTRMSDSIAMARSLNIGDKVYLYGVNLAKGQIRNNGKAWYLTEYITESYIKAYEPESGKTAYDPTDAETQVMQFTITPNYVNSKHYVSGDCIFFDNENELRNEVKYNYSWWSSLMFAWDAGQDCFVCVSNDKSVGNGLEKTPVIPEGGFVIMDCGSESKEAVSSCLVGTKAWLYKNGSNYKICLNLEDPDGTPVRRSLTGLDEPVVKGQDEKGVIRTSEEASTITWDAVPGATEYLLSVNLSTLHVYGTPVLHPIRVTGTSYEFAEGTFEAGQKYTVFLQALASGKASLMGKCTLQCSRASALTSSLRDKTVVAFGDSLTARVGWVDMLPGFIGAEVINSGVGGDSTNAGKARFKKDVLDKNADIVLICFGMNDQAQSLSRNAPNVSLATYTANMEYFVTELQKQGADVVLICPHDAYNAAGYYSPGAYGLDYSYGNMEQFCDAVRRIAVKYGTGLVDIYTETSDEREDMSAFLNVGDGIHQSTYGHEKWADYIANYLLAKYDGLNKAEITVKCKDTDGHVLKEYAVTAAAGAYLQIPAAEIAGMNLVGQETICKATDGKKVEYVYLGESDIEKGDVNGDGSVNAKDYQMVKRTVLGSYVPTEEQRSRMDVTGDGSVNAKDYLLLKRVVLGTYSF